MRSQAPDPPPGANATKAVWREWARVRRRGGEPREVGRAIAEHIESWLPFAAARHVLVYLAFGDEPDLTPLLASSDKTFYTTRTEEPGPVAEERTPGPPLLTLHRLDPHELERHRFGFLQPSPLAAPVAAELIDLVLVPGLAFDRSGHRLGFGMGYYDRLLSTLEADVPRVGVVSARLLVSRLPAEEHDVRMTHLATEEGVVHVAEM